MAVVLIDHQAHERSGWRKPQTAEAFEYQRYVVLTLEELSLAHKEFPLAITRVRGEWAVIALLGIFPARNLFVGGRGEWLASYLPALMRAYPFVVVHDDDQRALGVDSRYLCDLSDASDPLVTPLYAAPGKLHSETEDIVRFVSALDEARQRGSRACEALDKAGLLTSLSLRVRFAGETEHAIDGLYQVSETALASMAESQLDELLQCGALSLALAQRASLPVLPRLVERAQRYAKFLSERIDSAAYPDSPNSEPQSDILSFENL